MIKTFNTKRLLWISFAILLLVTITASAKVSAQSISVEGLVRADMLNIAKIYATYKWQAFDIDNVVHGPNHVHTPDAETDYINGHDNTDSAGRDVSHTGWWKLSQSGEENIKSVFLIFEVGLLLYKEIHSIPDWRIWDWSQYITIGSSSMNW